jgi:hypothetical protein
MFNIKLWTVCIEYKNKMSSFEQYIQNFIQQTVHTSIAPLHTQVENLTKDNVILRNELVKMHKGLNGINEFVDLQRKQIDNLKQEIKDIQEKVDKTLKDRSLEHFYQKKLEVYFGGKHAKTKHGIIDILTDDMIIEVKNWPSYKSALGQLQSYALDYPNKKLMVVFFGDYPDKKKSGVVELFQSFNMTVSEVTLDHDEKIVVTQVSETMDEADGDDEDTRIDSTSDEDTNSKRVKFMSWLDNHMIQKDDAFLTLTEVCQAYLGKNVSSRIATFYRQHMESYIRNTYQDLPCEYKQYTVGNVKLRGWPCMTLTFEN